MNEKRPQQVGTSWGRLFFRWGLGAETGSPCKTRCERPGSPIRVLEFNAPPVSSLLARVIIGSLVAVWRRTQHHSPSRPRFVTRKTT